jgi:hypothetical protein
MAAATTHISIIAGSSNLVLGRYGPYRSSDCPTVPGIARIVIDYYYYQQHYYYYYYGGCENTHKHHYYNKKPRARRQ